MQSLPKSEPSYLVCYGVYAQNEARFDHFADALRFFREKKPSMRARSFESCRLLGKNYDGESDGLSEAERLEVIG